MVFSYVVKGIKFKITAQFRASRGLRFEDAKSIITTEMRPKSFETFEKRAPAPLCGRDFAHVQSSLTQAYVGKNGSDFGLVQYNQNGIANICQGGFLKTPLNNSSSKQMW